MSKTIAKPNPLLNYSINTSPDPTAIKIVSSFNIIYSNYIIICNTADNATDTSEIDNAASQILSSFGDITNIILPCINDPTPYGTKCTSNNNCTWASDIENISLDFIILLSAATPSSTASNITIKSEYQFVPFYMVDGLYNAIMKNKANLLTVGNPTKPTYYLCAGTPYNPRSTDPNLVLAYNKLTNKMNLLLQSNNSRLSDQMIINFLLYILLPTVVFIILILLYVKYTKKTPDTPIAKTGGALSDTLNFIGNIGLKIIRF
jgi:hypothetical protein